jgi:hypothetical protein
MLLAAADVLVRTGGDAIALTGWGWFVLFLVLFFWDRG